MDAKKIVIIAGVATVVMGVASWGLKKWAIARYRKSIESMDLSEEGIKKAMADFERMCNAA